MAKSSVQIPALCSQLAEDARRGVFKPVYLLMGDEPYYPDLVCDAVMANCVEEGFKDFNEYIFYGADTTADNVVSAARQYPMMSDRILVVVKEAQAMKTLEELAGSLLFADLRLLRFDDVAAVHIVREIHDADAGRAGEEDGRSPREVSTIVEIIWPL